MCIETVHAITSSKTICICSNKRFLLFIYTSCSNDRIISLPTYNRYDDEILLLTKNDNFEIVFVMSVRHMILVCNIFLSYSINVVRHKHIHCHLSMHYFHIMHHFSLLVLLVLKQLGIVFWSVSSVDERFIFISRACCSCFVVDMLYINP